MNAKRTLPKLETDMARRFLQLKSIAYEALTAQDEKTGQRLLAYVVIESQNTWSLFIRAFYLSCALSALRHDGSKVTCNAYGARHVSSAIDAAMNYLKPKTQTRRMRDEPTWHDKKTVIKLAIHLNFSNATDISSALSYPTDALEHLTITRNYYAHRNQETGAKIVNVARSYGLVGINHPDHLLKSVAPGRPQEILFDWFDDLRIIVNLLCR